MSSTAADNNTIPLPKQYFSNGFRKILNAWHKDGSRVVYAREVYITDMHGGEPVVEENYYEIIVDNGNEFLYIDYDDLVYNSYEKITAFHEIPKQSRLYEEILEIKTTDVRFLAAIEELKKNPDIINLPKRKKGPSF
jgi:hypothetical protein